MGGGVVAEHSSLLTSKLSTGERRAFDTPLPGLGRQWEQIVTITPAPFPGFSFSIVSDWILAFWINFDWPQLPTRSQVIQLLTKGSNLGGITTFCHYSKVRFWMKYLIFHNISRKWRLLLKVSASTHRPLNGPCTVLAAATPGQCSVSLFGTKIAILEILGGNFLGNFFLIFFSKYRKWSKMKKENSQQPEIKALNRPTQSCFALSQNLRLGWVMAHLPHFWGRCCPFGTKNRWFLNVLEKE